MEENFNGKKMDANNISNSINSQIMDYKVQNSINKAEALATATKLADIYQMISEQAKMFYDNNGIGDYTYVVTSDELKAGINQSIVNQIILEAKALSIRLRQYNISKEIVTPKDNLEVAPTNSIDEEIKDSSDKVTYR